MLSQKEQNLEKPISRIHGLAKEAQINFGAFGLKAIKLQGSLLGKLVQLEELLLGI